jgi:hypothetical protein
VLDLEEKIRPKLTCTRIELKRVDGELYCRAEIQNESSSDLTALVSYLESVAADDVVGGIENIDFPIPLYTQERLKDRKEASGRQPAMPFHLRGGQKKWVEVFQFEPIDHIAHIFLASHRFDFVAISGMVLHCVAYGAGEPIHFSITYTESDRDWTLSLRGTDGVEYKVNSARESD